MENSEIVVLIAVGTSLMLLLALTFVLFFNFSQSKLRNAQLKAQQIRMDHQEKLIHSTILTQEKERQRIAKDLHDEIGSKLNIVHLNLYQLSNKTPQKTDKNITQMINVINDTIDTTRRISHDLLPPTLESFGLESAIEELCERHQEPNSLLRIQFKATGQRPQSIDTLVELNLYRVLQELMSNTLKYAEADQVDIHLAQETDHIELIYQDNGKGFDVSLPKNQKGLGMKNIQSRLRMLAGTLQFETKPTKGFKAKIKVNL